MKNVYPLCIVMRYTKAFITLALLLIFGKDLTAQDLTGTWEAQQTINNVKYNYILFMAKTDNGYIAIDIVKEATSFKINPGRINLNNLGGTNVNITTNAAEKKNSATAEMIASFSNNILYYADLGLIGETKLNVKLVSGSLKYVKGKGREKDKLLPVKGATDPEYTKKNNNFPNEYESYKRDLVSVTSFKFINSDKTSKVKYNDRGVLSFSVNNNSDYDLQRINVSLKLQEQNAEIHGLEGNSGTFSLAKLKGINPEIDIFSGFNLPADSIHFTVVGTFNNVTLFTKTISLATIPFFLNDKTTVNKSSDQILAVVKPYYGFGKALYAPVVAGLNQSIVAGNKTAPMWKAAFLSTGKGGYEQDDEAALSQAKKVYKEVLLAARNGDAEAQYLMFYGVGLGLTGDPTRNIAGAFLKKSADAGFLPAMYDYSLYLMRDSIYDDSFNYLINCYNKGVQKAAVNIGDFYQYGYSVPKDFTKAIEWYSKGDAFGDPEAMMRLAKIYNINDDGHKAEPKKVVLYATKAANLKSTVALNYLAKIYLNGRNGVVKNIPKALALYKEAAALGDNKAMSSLAFLYLNGIPGLLKDEKLTLQWAKKSAQAGGADCMVLLAEMYNNGTAGAKDVIKTRFWANQARLNGMGDDDNTARQAQTNDMMNILTNIDLSDKHTTYVGMETGNLYDVNEGPDLIGSFFSSTMSAYKKRRENQQAQINGIKLIYTAGGKKVYGGTITSKITSDIMINEGAKVKIAGYGNVSLGMMAGIGTPDGISGFQSYCVDPTLPHGALMVKIGGKWTLAGSSRTFIMPADGILQFAINDADYSNNQGYFDFVVTAE